MSYTGASRLRTTPHEFFHDVRTVLSNKGLNDHKIDQVQMAFHSSLIGDPNHPSWTKGIDQRTLDQTMSYMRAHPHATALGEHEWGMVQEAIQHSINRRV